MQVNIMIKFNLIIIYLIIKSSLETSIRILNNLCLLYYIVKLSNQKRIDIQIFKISIMWKWKPVS